MEGTRSAITSQMIPAGLRAQRTPLGVSRTYTWEGSASCHERLLRRHSIATTPMRRSLVSSYGPDSRSNLRENSPAARRRIQGGLHAELVSALDRDVNIYQSSFRTGSHPHQSYPAHAAAWQGDVETISRDMGRNWREDPYGLYPTHVAVLRQKPMILKACLKQGLAAQMWRHPKYGKLPLIGFAAVYEQRGCVAAILSIEQGRDHHLNLRMGRNQGTLLHLTVESRAFNCFRDLFALYPRSMIQMLESKDKLGRTPLSLAAQMGSNAFVVYLEQFGASLEAKDTQGRRPIHLATMRGREKSVQLLADLGASPSPVDGRNKRPEAYARRLKEPKRGLMLQLLGTLSKRKSMAVKFLPDKSTSIPYNCVFSGGGVRCISFIGATRYCVETHRFREVRRYAGTSGGAILASLLAVGYTPGELVKTLQQVNLIDLIDAPRAARGIRKALKAGLNVFKTFTDPKEVIRKVLTSARGFCGAFTGDALRDWIDVLIRDKTGITNCTFKELRSLVIKDVAMGRPNRRRHLHVVCTRLGNPPQIVTPNSESEEWDDYIISDAVMGSACFPLVFQPHELRVKIWDYTDGGSQASRPVGHAARWKVLDGGFLMNCPDRLFDQGGYQSNGLGSIASQFPVHNLKTLAFRLHSPSSTVDTQKQDEEIKSLGGVVKQIMLIYYHAEKLLNRKNVWNDQRIVPVSNQGVFTFQLLPERVVAKQLDGGYQDAKKYFTGQSYGQRQFLGYDDDGGDEASLLITPSSRKEVAKLNRRAKIEGTVSAALFATSGASLGAGVAAAPFTGGLSMIPAGAVAGVTAIPAAGTAIAGYVHRRRAKKKEREHRQIEDSM